MSGPHGAENKTFGGVNNPWFDNQVLHQLPFLNRGSRHIYNGLSMNFVLARQGRDPIAIECKWRVGRSTANNFSAMRLLHPEIRCLVVAANGGEPHKIHRDGTVETGLDGIEKAVELLDQS